VPDGATRGGKKAPHGQAGARSTGESRDQTPEAKIRCRFDDKR
jgi:hypothetical protein